MSPSPAGIVVLLAIGAGFLAAGVWSAVRVHHDGRRRVGVGAVIDVLIGVAALVDAGLAEADLAARIAFWVTATVCLVASAALVIEKRLVAGRDREVEHR